MAASWQVKVGQNLSRPYTLEQLRTKRRSGTLDDAAQCTDDRGESFVLVDEVLQNFDELQPAGEPSAAATAGPARRLSRPQKKSSRLQKAVKMVQSDDALAEAPPTESPADDELLPELPDEATTTTPPLFSEPEPVPAAAADQKLFSGLSDVYKSALNNAHSMTAEEAGAPEEDAFYSGPAVDLSPATATPAVRTPRTPPARPRPATSVRDAAAQALAAESAAKAEPSPDAADLSRVVPGQRPGQSAAVPATGGGSRRRITSLLVVLAGLPALGLVIWWFGFGGPPSVEDLTGGSFNIEDLTSDALTVEELNARTQILSLQLARVTKALASRSQDAEPLDLSAMDLQTAPALPLMPFRPLQLTSAQAQRSIECKDSYTTLVQQQGPNGARLKAAVVSRHCDHLLHLATYAGSEGQTRAEALFQLSEWTKLLYLMQYGHLQSGGADADRARSELLAAANAGLNGIFAELKSGDMRFVDVFERCSAEEQAQLLLVRYWYYRAVDVTAADAWLKQNLAEIDEQYHAGVTKSITEVTEIVGLQADN